MATISERLGESEWRRRFARVSDFFRERMWLLPAVGPRLVSAEHELVPAGPCRVLFLCKGNICRSIFAELVARKLAGDRSGWEFRSAGLEAGVGTPSPEAAVRVGKEFGVDLASHLSRPVEPADLAASDVVFVMEPGQRSQALELTGPIHPGVALLGAFCARGAQSPVIQDPFGHNDQAFRYAFERIRDAVATVLARDEREGRRS